jgi:serine/threonine protein kinase
VVNLKQIGSRLYHNLIAKQYRFFSDQHRVYFMSRWVEGEDLFDLLTKKKKLSVPIVKHFAACILNIMEYLHLRRILWRELKV